MQPTTNGRPAGGAQAPPFPQQAASSLAAPSVTSPVSVRWLPVSSPPAWGATHWQRPAHMPKISFGRGAWIEVQSGVSR